MADPNDILLGRRSAIPPDSNAVLLGQAAHPDVPADPNAVLLGKGPPTAGPLDVRPAVRMTGELAKKLIPQPVQDFVGNAGAFIGNRLGAMGEVVTQPFVQGRDLSPEAVSQTMLGQRPLVNWSQEPFDPLKAVGRVGSLGRAAIFGKTPFNEPASTLDLLKEQGAAPLMTPEEAEAVNRQYAGLPIGSVARAATTPEAASLAAESLAPVPLANAIGKGVALPAARALGDAEIAGLPIRRIPGIKQGLETFGRPGATLPGKYRETMQDVLRKHEGRADFRSFIREKKLGEAMRLPTEVQDRIANAVETRQIGALVPEEKVVATRLVKEYERQVSARKRAGLRGHELGAHLEPLRKKVYDAALKWSAKPKSDLARANFKKAVRGLERATNTKLWTKNPIQTVMNIKQLNLKPVEFTKRVLTKEKRAQAGLKPFGTAVSPAEVGGGLSTGGMLRRLSKNFGKTTEQINERNLLKHGFRAYEPVVKATMESGAANDLRVMNAGIVRDAVRRFGRAAQAGERRVGDIYSVKSGFTKGFKRRLDKTALPDEVHEFLDQLNKRLSPEEYGGFVAGMRKVNNHFKKWALFSPGFVARNMQNNLIQTSIFGNHNPLTWERAFRLRSALAKAKSLSDLRNITVKIGGKSVDGEAYVRSAIKRGVIGRGQIPVETGAELGEHRLNPFRMMRGVNTFGEELSRMSFDLYLQGKGLTPLQAARKVDDVLFRYSPRFQSKAFQRIRRYHMPFINWTTQIIPLLGKSILERPGSFGRLTEVSRRANQAQGFTQEKLHALGADIPPRGGVVLGPGEEKGSFRVLIPTGYGTYDTNPILDSVANKDVVGLVDEIANRHYPQFSVPYALLRGRDPLTDRELTGKPIVAPGWLKLLFQHEAGKKWANRYGITLDEKGVVKAPDRTVVVLRSLPQTRIPGLIADAIRPDRGSEFRSRSFLYGVTETDRNPKKGQFFQMKATKEGLAEATAMLRRYPRTAWPTVAAQFPVEVRRALLLRGYPIVNPKGGQ